MTDLANTPAKIARRLQELEEAAGAKQPVFVAPAPIVQDTAGNPLPKVQRALVDALWAAQPAKLHVLVTTHKQTPDIIIDEARDQATVIWNQEALHLSPASAATSYWVESGHLIV
jgi:CHASE1-domain containing sensor protein